MKNRILIFSFLALFVLSLSSCSFLSLRSGDYIYGGVLDATSALVAGSFELDKDGKVVNTMGASGTLDKDGNFNMVNTYTVFTTGLQYEATFKGKSDSKDQISGYIYNGSTEIGKFVATKQD